MTTLMRNDRDRRSGKPGMGHARKERVLLFGTRSADYIRASSQSGCIQRPNTWLHPNVSLNCPIFPLHRGRRPYMATGACCLAETARAVRVGLSAYRGYSRNRPIPLKIQRENSEDAHLIPARVVAALSN